MFKKIILGILLNALALYVVILVFKDIHYTGGILKFLIVGGLAIGLLNTFVKPAMKLLSLPLIFCSFGLFSLLINTIIFWLTVKFINVINFSGVSVNIVNPLTYFLAAFAFALVNSFIHIFIKNK